VLLARVEGEGLRPRLERPARTHTQLPGDALCTPPSARPRLSLNAGSTGDSPATLRRDLVRCIGAQRGSRLRPWSCRSTTEGLDVAYRNALQRKASPPTLWRSVPVLRRSRAPGGRLRVRSCPVNTASTRGALTTRNPFRLELEAASGRHGHSLWLCGRAWQAAHGRARSSVFSAPFRP
jgi:hypothetical protein